MQVWVRVSRCVCGLVDRCRSGRCSHRRRRSWNDDPPSPYYFWRLPSVSWRWRGPSPWGSWGEGYPLECGQVCTDTNLNVFPNGDGTESACVDIFTYAISSTGRSRVISDESGCNLAGTLTVGTDLSVTLASTDVGLFTCGRRSCSPSRTVSVSASDSPTSPVVTTTTKSTTTVGGCTYRTSTEEQDADVAGTLTIDSSTLDETGFVIVVSQRSTVHCH